MTSYCLRIYQTAGQALVAWQAIARFSIDVLEVSEMGTDILIHLHIPLRDEADFRRTLKKGMELTLTT